MNTGYFNSVAKWGLILGILLSVSRIYEAEVMISGDITKFAVLTVEWIAVAALYIYILFKVNKIRSKEADPHLGYPFRTALNYSMLISAFAGIIVGAASHIHVVNVIGGYDAYAMQSITSISNVLKEANVEQNIQELYDAGLQSVKTMGENPPSLFSTMISMMANYIISGFVIGLIVGYFTKKAPIAPEQQINVESNE